MSGREPAPAMQSDRETRLAGDARLELRLWLRLLTCSTLIERLVRSKLRTSFDMTLPRFDFLAQLDRARDGLTMGELSDRLMVSNGNVTGLADRLAQEGLIMREVDAADRRSQRVRLTPAGKVAFDAMTPAHEAWIDQAMAGLTRTELAQLHQLLGRLKTVLHDNLRNGDDGRKHAAAD